MERDRLTKGEILAASEHWLEDDESYLDQMPLSDEIQAYFERLREHDVLEIGPGQNPVNERYACGSYESASGSYPDDGLSVLKEKADDSRVVVSFGVFCDDVLISDFRSESKDLAQRYAEELGEEVERVASPFAIIYGTDVAKYLGEPDIPVLPSSPEAGGVFVYEQEE